MPGLQVKNSENHSLNMYRTLRDVDRFFSISVQNQIVLGLPTILKVSFFPLFTILSTWSNILCLYRQFALKEVAFITSKVHIHILRRPQKFEREELAFITLYVNVKSTTYLGFRELFVAFSGLVFCFKNCSDLL